MIPAPPAMQSKLQAQLQPLMALVDELAADAQRTGYVPDFRSLGEWLQEQERAAAEAGRATVELALPREFDSAARPQVDSGEADALVPPGMPDQSAGWMLAPQRHQHSRRKATAMQRAVSALLLREVNVRLHAC